MLNLYHETRWLALLALLIVSRLIPHPPNFTATMAVLVLLQSNYPRWPALALTIAALFISDCLLAFGWEIPLGIWTLFSYSGWIFCALLATYANKYVSAALLTLNCTLLFWLWSNFGVWLIGGLYPHDITGFIACYTMAIPFLGQSLLADMLWVSILSLTFGYKHLWQRQVNV